MFSSPSAWSSSVLLTGRGNAFIEHQVIGQVPTTIMENTNQAVFEAFLTAMEEHFEQQQLLSHHFSQDLSNQRQVATLLSMLPPIVTWRYQYFRKRTTANSTLLSTSGAQQQQQQQQQLHIPLENVYSKFKPQLLRDFLFDFLKELLQVSTSAEDSEILKILFNGILSPPLER